MNSSTQSVFKITGFLSFLKENGFFASKLLIFQNVPSIYVFQTKILSFGGKNWKEKLDEKCKFCIVAEVIFQLVLLICVWIVKNSDYVKLYICVEMKYPKIKK